MKMKTKVIYAVMATSDEGVNSLRSVHSDYDLAMKAIDAYYETDRESQCDGLYEYEVQSAYLD